MSGAPDVAPDVAPLVEHLFRRQAGAITAALARSFGAAHLDAIDDAVQGALVAALRAWSVGGVPANPEGWLVRVATNRLRDELRRGSRHTALDAAGVAAQGDAAAEPRTPDAGIPALDDDVLRLVLACCHPALPPGARVALTLKCVSGFGVDEIARLLRADRRAVAQRIVRAKRALRALGPADLEAPAPAHLAARLDDVLAVTYAVFTEGHTATAGDALVRGELVAEALRLQALLVASPHTATPPAHALHALMLFGAARLPARIVDGRVVTLDRQDRVRWDRALVARGFHQLARSAAGERYTRYHAEAEIAALHAEAPTWAATDWPRVVQAYDRLLQVAPSAVARLGRAIAVAEAGDVRGALRAVVALARDPRIATMPEVHAARAELARRLGRTVEAARAYRAALALPAPAPVRHHLADQLARLRDPPD